MFLGEQDGWLDGKILPQSLCLREGNVAPLLERPLLGG